MDDRLEQIGKRIEQAAWMAVAIHLGQSTEQVRENENQGQTVVIGGAGPRWFRDEQLPAPIARQGRSSHNTLAAEPPEPSGSAAGDSHYRRIGRR